MWSTLLSWSCSCSEPVEPSFFFYSPFLHAIDADFVVCVVVVFPTHLTRALYFICPCTCISTRPARRARDGSFSSPSIPRGTPVRGPKASAAALGLGVPHRCQK